MAWEPVLESERENKEEQAAPWKNNHLINQGTKLGGDLEKERVLTHRQGQTENVHYIRKGGGSRSGQR